MHLNPFLRKKWRRGSGLLTLGERRFSFFFSPSGGVFSPPKRAPPPPKFISFLPSYSLGKGKYQELFIERIGNRKKEMKIRIYLTFSCRTSPSGKILAAKVLPSEFGVDGNRGTFCRSARNEGNADMGVIWQITHIFACMGTSRKSYPSESILGVFLRLLCSICNRTNITNYNSHSEVRKLLKRKFQSCSRYGRTDQLVENNFRDHLKCIPAAEPV